MTGGMPFLLIGASGLMLCGVAFSEAVQLGYGFVFMLFVFPLQAILGKGAAFAIVGRTLWWLLPALPGIIGLLMLFRGNAANG